MLIYDIAPLLTGAGSATLDKRQARNLGKAQFPSDIACVSFNPVNANYVAVAGIKDCQVMTLGAGGDVVAQLAVDLQLEALGEDLIIRKVQERLFFFNFRCSVACCVSFEVAHRPTSVR